LVFILTGHWIDICFGIIIGVSFIMLLGGGWITFTSKNCLGIISLLLGIIGFVSCAMVASYLLP